MTYQVLARKWRPQEFDTVVGQEPVTRTLRNALVSGRVAHAYLFTGPRGVGKTTTARLLAKALCCPAREGAEACGACPSCTDFVSGAPVDVMEIDAASNTSVDDIRTLRENVKYAPARGRFKVYIIDEVHMLSTSAFNAFLKTLEEPPAHVIFILATTDPKKIPATVLSRCQRFDFKPIAPEALGESLTAILKAEHVQFEPAALPLLVRAAEGSLRDALSLLDTAIAYGQGELTEAGVAQLLGSSSPVHVRAFLEALLGRDGGTALEAIDRAATAGEDLAVLCRDVVELARRVLVLKTAPGTGVSDLTPAEAESLRATADPVSVDELIYLLRAFLDADAEMRRSPHPRVELEIAAVRTTRRPEPKTLDTLLAKVEDALAQVRGAASLPAGGGRAAAQEALLSTPSPSALDSRQPPSARPAGGQLGASSEAPRQSAAANASVAPRASSARGPFSGAAPSPGARASSEPLARGAAATAPPDPSRHAAAVSSASTDIAPPRGAPAPSLRDDAEFAGPGDSVRDAEPASDLESAWQRVIAEVMKKKAVLGTVLQGAVPVAVEGDVLVLNLTGNHFHKDRLAEPASREVINQAVQQIMPGVRRISVDESAAAAAGGPRIHPAVQAALNAFQGEVVAVRPRAPEEGDST